MFYSQFILAKKGPLGTIWIAAHLERKLRKNQVTETNISVSVDSILFPEVPIALRLSGHLLLGVVRIYSRKVNYLFHDCSEALVKIKQAFHAGAVDLPPEAATAPFHSITLPETFDLDEFEPLLDKELNSLHANGSVDHHITSREQITLQDPMEDSTYLGSSQFELDERFPDGDAPQLEIDFDEDLLDKRGGAGSQAASPLNEEDELPLEEDVIPPVRMDDELDYDQMDRMEEMDIDDHHEPGTPALGLDNMDLDYQREPDEQLDAGQDDLERLEPSFAMDHEDLGATDVGAERLAHEPATPGSPENEALDYKESGLDLDLEASVEHALEEDVEQRVEEHVAVHGEEEMVVFDDREAAGHVVEEKVEQGEEEKEKVDEGVEREVEEQDETVKPSLETGVNVSGEKTSDDDRGEMTLLEGDEAAEVQEAVIGDEQAADKELGEEGPADVPEYETVMSAPGITNQDPDVFDMDAGMGMEPASDFMPYEEGAREEQTAEEGPPIFEEEAHPGFQEEPQPGIAYPMSPMRSPPVPVISSEDLPGDDELLASLPGRRISALALVPTPVDNASAKPRRRQGQRKRKIVIDLGTILGADVMKQQLENTDDIRRVRRKAPCTRQELWSVQKDSLNQQLFCEHSVPGLCGELRVLFERVYVVGEANLPQADPVEPEMAPGEELPEVQQHSVVEDLNADMNVEVHPDDMKEIENEVAGSPVFDGVPDTAPVDHPQTEDTGAPSPLHIVERVSSPVEALEAKAEETQNLQIRTPVLEHGEQATLDSPKGELPNVLDTEVVNPVDLNSASLEMEEAMETLREEEAMEAMETMETDVQGTVDTSAREELELLGRLETPETAAVGEYHPMIDVNVTNTEVENEGLEGSLPEFGNAPGTEGIAGPDYGPATVSSDAEFASGTLPSSEAETEPYIQGKVEETQRIDTQVGFGPGEFASDTLPMSEAETEPYIQGEVEDTQRIDTQVGFGPSDDVHGVGSVGFDTQILPTEEYSRQEEGAVYVPQEEGDFFSGSLPDDKTEADDTQPAVPFETAPVQEQPEENLEFLADARDTEFLGADDDDLVEEPEDFQELNEYARKEPVSHDNSGWSARTRAVGHFLRITLEDKDAYMQRRNEQGVAKLGLERMLVGKSRKEAARMFFETLVLKTKDYIHVEQDQAYGDIQISARPKLMKAKF